MLATRSCSGHCTVLANSGCGCECEQFGGMVFIRDFGSGALLLLKRFEGFEGQHAADRGAESASI